MLLGFDLVSGKPAWAPRDIGFPPVRPPIFKDFDADGVPEMLVIAQESVGDLPLPVAHAADGTLTCGHMNPFGHPGRSMPTGVTSCLGISLQRNGRL